MALTIRYPLLRASTIRYPLLPLDYQIPVTHGPRLLELDYQIPVTQSSGSTVRYPLLSATVLGGFWMVCGR